MGGANHAAQAMQYLSVALVIGTVAMGFVLLAGVKVEKWLTRKLEEAELRDEQRKKGRRR